MTFSLALLSALLVAPSAGPTVLAGLQPAQLGPQASRASVPALARPPAFALFGISQAQGQSRLASEADQFAQAWARRDTEALGRFLAPDGIRLHLPGEDHQLIRPRQARAALEIFQRQYSQGRTEVNRVSPTGEGSREGFAEIRWVTGSPGLAEPVIFTVFIGYGMADDGWVVTEIRVLF